VNASGVSLLKVKPHAGVGWRAVPPLYAGSALATTYSATVSSRFSPATVAHPGFEILYLAETRMVAEFEVRALLGSPMTPGGIVVNPAAMCVVFPMQFQVSAIADLSDPSEASAVGTNAQELTGDWQGYRFRGPHTSVTGPTGKAPTQDLGEQLFALRPDVKGLISLSARVPYHRILAIFPQRLIAGTDFVQYNSPGGAPIRIP
jgi:RES domain-containing protein